MAERYHDVYLNRLLHAFYSALIPGAGQIAVGARRLGVAMLAAAILVLICGIALALQEVDQVLSWLVQPSVLLMLLAVNAILLAFRLFAVVDAFNRKGARPRVSRDGSSEGRQKLGIVSKPSTLRTVAAGAVLAGILLFAAAPHGVAGYYTYLSRDLLTDVFAGQSSGESGATSSLLSTSESVLTTQSTTGSLGGPSSTASVMPGAQTTSRSTSPATATTDALLEWGEDQRLTVLLIGTDAGYGRRGARADSVGVVTLDLKQGYVGLFGIPRNAGDLPLGEKTAQALGLNTYADMISNLYEAAGEHPELAPEGGDAGAVALRETVSILLGIPVHYYAVVDMAGLINLVDALGGIKLNVKERVRVELSPPTADEDWRVYDIKPGIQELDGHEALAFARSRTGTSDYDRMRRQRCVLMALLRQNGVAELVLRFPAVAQAIRDNLKTDIPLDKLPDLIRVRDKLNTDDMLTLGFIPPEYTNGRNSLGYNILDQALIQATIREYVEKPAQVLEALEADHQGEASDCWKVD